MRTLVLSPDWDIMLVWRGEHGHEAVDETTLPISAASREELNKCYKWFSDMFFVDDARPTPTERRLFDERAFDLWLRLRKELELYSRIVFYSQEFACEFETPEEFKAAQRAARSAT